MNKISTILQHFLVVLAFTCVCTITFARQPDNEVVKLNNLTISPLPNAAQWFEASKGKSSPVQVLVHLTKLPGIAERAQLQESGIDLQDYIDGKTYTAIIYLGKSKARPIPAITYGVTDVLPLWKIGDDVAGKMKLKTQLASVIVSCYDVVNEAEIKAHIVQLGGTIEPGGLENVHIYKVNIASDKLPGLAGYYAVKFISAQAENVSLNFEAKTASKSNIGTLSTAFGGYGLSGKGVTVGVGDNVSGNMHIDLKDRITSYNPASYTDHGVHINGIVGGAGIMDIKGEGVAPGAKLVNHLYSLIWEETPVLFPLHNMTITSNSYAAVVQNCDYSGRYNVYSEAIDKLALQYNEVLHVFAAGNDGNLKCSPYPDGFATVTGGYQPAKNNIVVTSADKKYVNAADGSRGPVKDGRLKPEITSVGVDVNSTTKTEEYLVAGGTSMACPGVSGALALLTERYKQLTGGSLNPRADLLKTLILNGTTDIGNPGPDYRFGFGFMNLNRSMQMLQGNRFTTNVLSNGAQQTINITVPANTAQLKVMLCWQDAAASPLSAKQLVNDLDLEVAESSSVLHRPLVLDPAPGNILANATEQADRLNNTEQVTVNNPQAGSYTVTVKGFNVPSATQDYVIAYDFVPVGVSLTYPTAGAQIKANDTLLVYWDASDNTNPFTLEFSTDGGGAWTIIDNNIPATQRYYRWGVPNINSGKCRMRITQNSTGLQNTSGAFIINLQPIITLDATQCPGYIRITWPAIPNATAYEVLKKQGAQLQVADTINTPAYTFSGLWPDSNYYIVVRPVIDGLSGYRSLALKRKPNDGNCAGNISDGDLAVMEIRKPVTGRRFTSTALRSNDSVIVMVRNLDDAPVNNYTLHYSINGALWQVLTFSSPIPALVTIPIVIPGLDFSAIGSYNIRVAIQNNTLSDNVVRNDSAYKTVRQLDNQPVSIAGTLTYNFENWGVVEISKDSIGISPDDHWDYTNFSDTCRLRSFVKNGITINGNRSISMDAIYNTNGNHRNDFTGTFNMAAYNAANEEVRMEFKYLLHGKPRNRDSNQVYIRGNDQLPWKSLFIYDNNAGGLGKVYTSGSLSVTDGLLGGSQNFSASTQVKFTQNDVSLISRPGYGNGITLDDVKFYTVQNDMQLLEVVSPGYLECGLTGEVPLAIKVRNGVNQVQKNVQLNYRLDNNSVVSETLPTINGKQTLTYTFTRKMDMSRKGSYILDIWIAADSDSYLLNDTISNYKFHNQPLITTYPYNEDFEAGDGYWFADGRNSSWAYGKPASPKINKAASGQNAWKTNLAGNYNPGEVSYLYSPCFDISTLKNPVYRFKTAMDIEYCAGILCDGAAMEYTTDNKTWLRLGKAGEGTGWYNDTLYTIWSIEDNIDWHTAAISLPKGLQTIKLRYLFASDLGGELEGLAIDDVEIFDELPPVVDNKLISISPNPVKDGKLTIAWDDKNGSGAEIIIYNTLGKQVYSTSIKGTIGQNKASLQTPLFASGVYMVRVVVGNRRFSAKVVYL